MSAPSIEDVLRREGAERGNGIHSWRCPHPHRYGPCDCIEQLADVIRAEVLSALLAEAKTEALDDAADDWPADMTRGESQAWLQGRATRERNRIARGEVPTMVGRRVNLIQLHIADEEGLLISVDGIVGGSPEFVANLLRRTADSVERGVAGHAESTTDREGAS